MAWVEEQTRLSIKNILIATMFSEPSEAILRYVRDFARHYGSKVSLTGAASTGAICETIRKWQIDLVAIGTQAQDVRESVLDTAVGEILRTVPCPMLIIGPSVTQMELTKGDLERILYVTDYTISSLDGLPYALSLAQDRDAQLKFVHVPVETPMGPYHFGNSRTMAFRKRLESLVAAGNGFSHESAGMGFLRESEFFVSEGDRACGLVRIAVNLHASLIVMSAGGTSGLLWSVAGPVICRAHCPVLNARSL